MTEIRSEALIALGGNLPTEAGPPERTLVQAIETMAKTGLVINAVSRFFATPCFPPGAGPDYVNAAVRLGAALDPPALLSALHDIEASFGRVRAERWGTRTLDLDLLAVDQTVLPDPATQRDWQRLPPQDQAGAVPDQLILPHPRLQDRAFVLVPLADIAPGWRHPLLGRTVRELCASLPVSDLAALRPL